MKTIKEITDQSRIPAAIINDLKQKTIILPPWSKLEKEYEPRFHPVMTDKNYKDKVKKGGIERMTRLTMGLQKLAVKRIGELCFGIPVKRVYKTNSDREQHVAEMMEAIFTKNRIDSMNIERSKMLYAACEFATIWYSQETKTEYAGESSLLKLRCRNFSPINGDELYPLFDDYDDMIALSVAYSRTLGSDKFNYFETYTDSEHIRWVNKGNEGWQEELREVFEVGKITGVYGYRPEPIWEDESKNVFEAEWSLSRNGNYLRKNSRPNWVIYCDEELKIGTEKNNDTESRNVLKYPSSAKAGYETWEQAIDSLKFHVETIRKNFFVQLQLPDMSMESMKAAPMSGEARQMMFIDGQLKVTDESGVWLNVFYREINVIKAFMTRMFPGYAKEIESLNVEVIVTPYQIKDDSTAISNYTKATGGNPIMSTRTAVRNLGYVDNVDEEIALIMQDKSMDLQTTLEGATI